MKIYRLCLLLAALAFELSSGARAADPLYNRPVYDPISKKYFEMVFAPQLKWREVLVTAEMRQYKGARGHLAIVDSAEIHEFLFKTFHPDKDAWIGIRYLCQRQVLSDSLGRTMNRNTFQVWEPKWTPDPYACNGGVMPKDEEYAPIAYDKNFRWLGYGHAKKFDVYFVEYDTKGP